MNVRYLDAAFRFVYKCIFVECDRERKFFSVAIPSWNYCAFTTANASAHFFVAFSSSFSIYNILCYCCYFPLKHGHSTTWERCDPFFSMSCLKHNTWLFVGLLFRWISDSSSILLTFFPKFGFLTCKQRFFSFVVVLAVNKNIQFSCICTLISRLIIALFCKYKNASIYFNFSAFRNWSFSFDLPNVMFISTDEMNRRQNL